MAKELKDIKGLKRISEDKYVWSQEYEAELTQEDFDKNYNNLKLNIEASEKKLKEFDVRKSVEKLKITLQNQKKINEESIKNFDKYVEESLETIKEKLNKDKEGMKNFINNYDEIVKAEIQKEKEKVLKEISEWKELLQDQKEKIKYYDEIKED